jgi:hypothetical protein
MKIHLQFRIREGGEDFKIEFVLKSHRAGVSALLRNSGNILSLSIPVPELDALFRLGERLTLGVPPHTKYYTPEWLIVSEPLPCGGLGLGKERARLLRIHPKCQMEVFCKQYRISNPNTEPQALLITKSPLGHGRFPIL